MKDKITPNRARKWRAEANKALAAYRAARGVWLESRKALRMVLKLDQTQDPPGMAEYMEATLGRAAGGPGTRWSSYVTVLEPAVLHTRIAQDLWARVVARAEDVSEDLLCAADTHRQEYYSMLRKLASFEVELGAAWSANALKRVQFNRRKS